MQIDAIKCLLQKHNTALRMPTGSGKTVCYLTPSLISAPSIVIILVPLIALLEDLFFRLHAKINLIDLRKSRVTYTAVKDYDSLMRNGESIFFISTHEAFLGQKILHAFLDRCNSECVKIVHDGYMATVGYNTGKV